MFGTAIEICKLFASAVAQKTGTIMANLAGPGGEEEETGEKGAGQPMFSALGVIARPLPPGKAEDRAAWCEAVTLRIGNQLIPIAYRDSRLNALYPSISEGTVALVGYSGAFVRTGVDGVVSTYTTEDNTPTGRPVFFSVRPDGFFWESPYGRASMTERCVSWKHHGGARLELGALGMPFPLDAMSDFATLTAKTVSLVASIVNLGPDTLVRHPVALATPTSFFLETLIQATAVAIGAAGPGGPAAATTFIATMTAAVAQFELAMPSKSTMSS